MNTFTQKLAKEIEKSIRKGVGSKFKGLRERSRPKLGTEQQKQVKRYLERRKKFVVMFPEKEEQDNGKEKK